MIIQVNGTRVGQTMVDGTSWSNYSFPMPVTLTGGDKVDIVFVNDEASDSEDRNLWVRELTWGDHLLDINPTNTLYDLGDGVSDATNGVNTIPGQIVLPWNGALRLTWPGSSTDAIQEPQPPPEALPTGTTVTTGIVAQSGQTIRGARVSNPSGPCIYIPRTVRDVTIEDSDIGPCGGGVTGVGIELQPDATNVAVRGNRIHDVASGLYATGAKHPITFERNVVTDVRGPSPRGQMVQFDQVYGGSGQSRIAYNVSDKWASKAQTHMEDHVNLHGSSGTSMNPILVVCNKMRGGDSASGSGVLASDGGGGWVTVRNNTIVLTTNTGIGVPGGHDVVITGNRIFNAGDSPESLTEGAAYVATFGSSPPTNIVLTGNRGVARGWISDFGKRHYSFWTDRTGVNVQMSDNNWDDTSLTAGIWDEWPAGC